MYDEAQRCVWRIIKKCSTALMALPMQGKERCQRSNINRAGPNRIDSCRFRMCIGNIFPTIGGTSPRAFPFSVISLVAAIPCIPTWFKGSNWVNALLWSIDWFGENVSQKYAFVGWGSRENSSRNKAEIVQDNICRNQRCRNLSVK